MSLATLIGDPITDPGELAATIAQIVRETERWDQGVWFSSAFFRHADDPELDVTKARASLNTGCGATACVAGWSVILHAPAGSLIDVHDTVTIPGQGTMFAATYGQVALRLDTPRADWLFDGQRTRTAVLYVLDAIAAGRSWSTDEGDALPEPDQDEDDYGYQEEDEED